VADASGDAGALPARADAIRADRTNQGDFAWRKSGVLPCDVWQAFGLAQNGDRVGLVSTPTHCGLTAIIKEVHLYSHWPSRLCVVLENRNGEELDDILRSDVVLLSASSSALGKEDVIDSGFGNLGGPKEDLPAEKLGEGAETQLALMELEPPCAEADSRCRNAETSTVSIRVALWIVITADTDPKFRIAPTSQQASLALLIMNLHVHTQTPAAQVDSKHLDSQDAAIFLKVAPDALSRGLLQRPDSKHLDSQDGGAFKEESVKEKRKEPVAKAAEAAPISAPQASEQQQRALQQMALHEQLRQRQLRVHHSGFQQQIYQHQQHSAFPLLRGQQQPQWQHFNNRFNLRFPAPRPPPLPPRPAQDRPGPLPSNGVGWPGRPLGY